MRRLPLLLRLLLLGVIVCCFMLLSHRLGPGLAQSPPEREWVVPELRPHPLPSTLAQWSDPQDQGDYFDQIQTTKVGYLVWSQFPLKVYIAPAIALSAHQARIWPEAVRAAVAEWQQYLSLVVVDQAQSADIAIAPLDPQERSQGRVRSAEAVFDLYVDAQQRLAHRFEILIRPNQTSRYMTAAVRHELGHALGIWGHSPVETDALYFSQIRDPGPISVRDLNTLKRVYEQPTRLGWSVVRAGPPSPINQTDR